MKRKFLEDLGLDKEIIDKVLDEHSTSVGKLKGEVETLTTERDTLKAENKNLKDDVANRDKQLDDLKNSTEDVAGLKKQIEDLQNSNKTNDENHKNEMSELKKSFAIEKGLTDAKAKNNVAVKALLDLTKIELAEDGTVKGLSEQIDALVKGEDTKFLFNNSTFELKGVIKADDSNKKHIVTKKDLKEMTYEERANYFNENPYVY